MPPKKKSSSPKKSLYIPPDIAKELAKHYTSPTDINNLRSISRVFKNNIERIDMTPRWLFMSNFNNHHVDFIVPVPGKTKEEASKFFYKSKIPAVQKFIKVNEIKDATDLYEIFESKNVLSIKKIKNLKKLGLIGNKKISSEDAYRHYDIGQYF